MKTNNIDSTFSVKTLPKLLPEAPAPLPLEAFGEDSPFERTSLVLSSGPSREEVKKLEADNTLPHQHEVPNYFSFKRLEASTVRKFPFLKVLRIGKGKFLEMPRLPQHAFSALGILVLGVFLWWQGGNQMFQADITMTNKPSPVAFDGTVYPFAKAPNWFATGGKNSRLYSEYSASELVDAPKYDVGLMQKEAWEKTIVNAKITYPIVYMGKYKYDHLEDTGSHPAVDIKLPTGTPVFSISSGLVVKSQDLTSGFGKHIVVRHDKVPNYGTIYVSYSHLSERLVKSGDIVSKGQEIGKVGDSGNATTAHIHFQIDVASAPFYPYWPFTTAEANAKKVNFFEAVNIGLGKEKAQNLTIHPFEFIHANMGSSAPVVSKSTPKPTVKPTAKPTIASTPNATVKSTPTQAPLSEVLSGYSLLAAPSKILSGDALYLSVYAKNQNGKWCASCAGSGTISYFEGKEKKSISFLLANGASEQKVILKTVGKISFTLSGNGFSQTVTVEVLPRPTTIATPKPTVAVLSSKLSSADLFKDISTTHANAKAIAFLKNKEVIAGYADGSFKPNNSVKRAEALKMMFGALNVGSNRNVGNPFADVKNQDWFAPYVLSAYDLDLVQGYSDGTFRPEKTVTRAEFFKMLAKLRHVSSLAIPKKNPFSDVEARTWVAPYAQWAKDEQLLDFGIEFSPNKAMTRGEMAEALYRVIN